MKQQVFDLEPKKRPRQGRSQATWDAMLSATAQLLCERGYHGVTTNHVAEAAGVSIGTVYEYFPGKDAIVAAVATRFINQLLAYALQTAKVAIPLPAHEGVRYAVDAAYERLLEEKELIRVLLFQVPFTQQLDAFKNLGATMLQGTVLSNRGAAPNYRVFSSPASLYLLNALLGSTLLQLTLAPPEGIAKEEILQALTEKVVEWTAPMGQLVSE